VPLQHDERLRLFDARGRQLTWSRSKRNDGSTRHD